MATWDGSVERRSSPRSRLRQPIECRTTLSTRVQLLDLSLSGALLATDLALPVGTGGHLTTFVGSDRIASAVEVSRSTSAKSEKGRELGLRFVEIDARSRKSLEDFLRRAAE